MTWRHNQIVIGGHMPEVRRSHAENPGEYPTAQSACN
jgi:hypothetical protein